MSSAEQEEQDDIEILEELKKDKLKEDIADKVDEEMEAKCDLKRKYGDD